MSKDKNEEYYKKLYNKLKKVVVTDMEKLLKDIDVLQAVLTFVIMSQKDQKIKITFKDMQSMDGSERLTREIKKNGDIIFGVKKLN